jgi:hypothetical protein
MSEYYSDEPQTPERRSVQVRFGEEIATFSPSDTIIRRFAQGDGAFDHCVHMCPDGMIKAFTPDGRTMEALLDIGCQVRTDPTIDEATINHYAALQAAAIDDERDMLDL